MPATDLPQTKGRHLGASIERHCPLLQVRILLLYEFTTAVYRGYARTSMYRTLAMAKTLVSRATPLNQKGKRA